MGRINQEAPLELAPGRFRYFLAKAGEISERIEGRITSPERMAVVAALTEELLRCYTEPDDAFSYVEIGVLHGGSLCLMMEAVPTARFVGIDLFTYYGSEHDPVSGIPVSFQQTFKNIRLFGKQRCELIQGNSHDHETSLKLQNHLPGGISALLIDGDHSYSGVERDFELYSPLVERGGLVFFDDYGSSRWPEVKQFVNTIDSKDWRHFGEMREARGVYVLQREFSLQE